MAFFYLTLPLLLVTLVFYLARPSKKPAGVEDLPGPRGIPYVGVPHKVSTNHLWLKFQEWSKVYGPIYKLKIMGQDIVVVSDKKILEDLFVRRKANFSSRPYFPSLPGANYNMRYLPLLAAGEHHRRARRFASNMLSRIPQRHFVDITISATKDYLKDLLQDPSDAKNLTELYASRITCEISWGNPTVAKTNVEAAWALLRNISPGATTMNRMPFLSAFWDVLPTKLQPWKAEEVARRAREREFWLTEREQAKTRTDDSFTLTRETYKNQSDDVNDDEEVANSVGMLTIIGSLLLATPVQYFLMAMCHFPEWQAKGAEEMDRVCPGRLPTPEDFKNLPVLRAIIREVNRWRPPVPLGAPHCSEHDDVYNGRFIPGGTAILSLVWALERDPAVYPDPEAFRPERWLEPSWPTYREPLTVYPQIKGHCGFGSGARVCIGQEYMEVVNGIMIGSLLACCSVTKAQDSRTGQPTEIDTMASEPFLAFIRPYAWKMEAKLRSPERLL